MELSHHTGEPVPSSSEINFTALPKVHVHAHLDGSYPLAAILELAKRQGRAFSAPRRFHDSDSFFLAYGEVPELVRSLDDLEYLCERLVEAEAAAGVIYFEPAIEPQLYSPRLGSIESVTAAMLHAIGSAAARCGIQVGANLTINTDQDDAIAETLTETAIAFYGRGVTALGTAGFIERGVLGQYKHLALAAQEAGLQVVSHAGQVSGPESVFEAIDEFGATRISHGVQAVRSKTLLARLAADQIVCDVCPVSNVELHVSRSLAEHQTPALVKAGVPVTLNADDELWFGRSVNDQYRVATEIWGWDAQTVAQVVGNGELIPALDESTRAAMRSGVAQWLAEEATNSGRET